MHKVRFMSFLYSFCNNILTRCIILTLSVSLSALYIKFLLLHVKYVLLFLSLDIKCYFSGEFIALNKHLSRTSSYLVLGSR